jgi:hypothetical protein
LSAKCSNSPSLHLPIGRSRLPARLRLLGSLGGMLALWILCTRAYPELAYPLLPLLLLCCWPGGQGPRVTGIEWRAGQWYVWRAGVRSEVGLRPGTVCLPGLVCFAWRDAAGRPQRSWLFADSGPEDALRRLRVRLRLEL